MKNLNLLCLLLFSSFSMSSLWAQQVRVTANSDCSTGQLSASVTYSHPSLTIVNSYVIHLIESDYQGNIGAVVYYSGPIPGTPTSIVFPASIPPDKFYLIQYEVNWQSYPGNPAPSQIRNSALVYHRTNNPDFTLNAWGTSPNGGFYCYASPLSKNPFYDGNNFGYAWYLEELDNNNQPRYLINNPSNWWTMSPNLTPPISPLVDLTNNFFVDFNPSSNNYNGTINSLPSNNFAGVFQVGRRYRITRGTWVNGFCSWRQVSKILYYPPAPLGKTSDSPEDGNLIIEDTKAPSFEELARASLNDDLLLISAFPNPNKGKFTIQYKSYVQKNNMLKIYDTSGKMIYERVLASVSGLNNETLDLKDFTTKGLYFLQLEGYNNIIKINIE